MEPEKALQLIDGAIARMSGSRADHVAYMQAIDALRKIVYADLHQKEMGKLKSEDQFRGPVSEALHKSQ